MKVTYRAVARNRIFEAVVTDDRGDKYVWSKPIYKRSASYQGYMGKLEGLHHSQAYDVEGWGTVPEWLTPNIDDFILERFVEHSEEFRPFYPIRRK